MNKIIKFGVVGVQGFGRTHITGILENKCAKLSMVCDISEELAKEVGEEYGVAYTTDYDKFLANPEIDAVCIVTPDQTHKDLVIKALKAGKHVLCEKPMTLILEESKEMVKAAKESDKFLMVGQICRFTPSFIKAKELVDNGEIGELFFVEGEYAHDYDGKQKTTPWRFDPAAPRHGMIGGGCHSVDLLRWIAGNPTEAVAYSNKKVLTDCPTDDCTVAILKFPNDVVGKVFCSIGCKRPYTMRTVLYGSEGTIIVDNTSNQLSIYKKAYKDDSEILGSRAQFTEIRLPIVVNNHNTKGEIAELIECIQNGKAPEVDAREGAITVSVCDAIIKSAAEHRICEVDYNF